MTNYSRDVYRIATRSIGHLEGITVFRRSDAKTAQPLIHYFGGIPYALPPQRFRSKSNAELALLNAIKHDAARYDNVQLDGMSETLTNIQPSIQDQKHSRTTIPMERKTNLASSGTRRRMQFIRQYVSYPTFSAVEVLHQCASSSICFTKSYFVPRERARPSLRCEPMWCYCR